jgi:cytochrome c biogenesis protein CcdA
MCDARRVAELVIIVFSVAVVDAINPSTIVPAFVLALGERPARRVAGFTAGVFAVSTAGGLAILFAFGRTFVTRLAHPSHNTRNSIELGIGIALILAAAVLWIFREHLSSSLRTPDRRGRSSLLLGAGIMAVELPTAFPYFAAILAILGAVHGAAGQAALVALYNVIFVAPLIGVAGVVARSGGRHMNQVARISGVVTRFGPIALPIGVAAIGTALVILGAT